MQLKSLIGTNHRVLVQYLHGLSLMEVVLYHVPDPMGGPSKGGGGPRVKQNMFKSNYKKTSSKKSSEYLCFRI